VKKENVKNVKKSAILFSVSTALFLMAWIVSGMDNFIFLGISMLNLGASSLQWKSYLKLKNKLEVETE
jgi:hypothetical protein